MNAEPSQQLLEQLKDIHSAGEPGWWPPAPGWWFLALILLIVLVFVLKKLLGLWAARRRRQGWLHALEHLNHKWDPEKDPQEYLAGLNLLFRAIAVKAFPGTACGRLQGKEWVSFIASLMPERHAFECLDALATGPYEAAPEFDVEKLNESARIWVKLYG